MSATGEQHPAGSGSDVTVIDVLTALGRQRRILWLWPLVAAVVAAGISLVLPTWYTATARILPPQQGGGGAAAMLAQLGGLGGLAGGALGLRTPSETYLGMLKSNTVSDALITRFKLKELYGVEYMVDARKVLRKRSDFAAEKSGIIVIETEARDPKLAADMANAYVEELYRLTSTLAVSDASQRRVFFEQQLQMTKDKLADAEVKLRQAIESGGLVSVDAQSRAAVETVARLRATISAKEIQLGAMRAYATETNPDRMRAEQELTSMRRELARLEGTAGGPLREDLALEGGRPAHGGIANIRLLREVKYQEVMFELMAKQYELARVEESKDAPLIQALDRATPPERRSWPKRGLIVVSTAVLALLAALVTAWTRHAIGEASADPGQRSRLEALREAWLRRR